MFDAAAANPFNLGPLPAPEHASDRGWSRLISLKGPARLKAQQFRAERVRGQLLEVLIAAQRALSRDGQLPTAVELAAGAGVSIDTAEEVLQLIRDGAAHG
jgi:hypothetical protein